jgi:hypothetical protein
MPGDADKPNLNRQSFRGSNEFRTHRFVGYAAVASSERQRIADVFGGGRDIEQQPRFARIRRLGEMQSKFVVLKRLRGVLKKLALRQSRDATLTIVNVALQNTGAVQQLLYWDVARAKDGDRLTCGEPRRAWQSGPADFPGHVRRSEYESLCD